MTLVSLDTLGKIACLDQHDAFRHRRIRNGKCLTPLEKSRQMTSICSYAKLHLFNGEHTPGVRNAGLFVAAHNRHYHCIVAMVIYDIYLFLSVTTNHPATYFYSPFFSVLLPSLSPPPPLSLSFSAPSSYDLQITIYATWLCANLWLEYYWYYYCTCIALTLLSNAI